MVMMTMVCEHMNVSALLALCTYGTLCTNIISLHDTPFTIYYRIETNLMEVYTPENQFRMTLFFAYV